MQELVLGIDVGGTNTKFGLVNNKGEIIAEGSCKTKGYPKFKDYLAHLMANVEQVRKTISSHKLVGVGVGAPNGNYYRGTIEEATNLEWKGTVYFTEQLKDYYADMPLILTNDANAAAIGEMKRQRDEGFYCIYIGNRAGQRNCGQWRSNLWKRWVCRRNRTYTGKCIW